MSKYKSCSYYNSNNAHVLFTFLISIMLFGCKEKRDEVVKSEVVQKPNIIFILADDLGYGDLGYTGQLKFDTPNIDKLANEGMVFTQHYSGSTVCAPSRSSLMTGQHTGHTPIRANKQAAPDGQFPLPSSAITVAELLKGKGYSTGAFGKWGLGYPSSEGNPNKQGFDDFFGYNCQRLAHNYYPFHLWENNKKVRLEENSGNKEGLYAPDLIHKKALAFIKKNRDNPFFMYYPSPIPHAELKVPEIYMKKYRGKLLPEKKYTEIDSDDIDKNGEYGTQEEAHTAFAAMIHLLDKQVGEIRKLVEGLGIADNTIIVFTSDNGPHLEGGADPDYFDSNAKLKGYKRDMYEGGIRVPMIVNWPKKIPINSLSHHISAFWDFLPTVCDLLEIDAPEGVDGISFLPTLLGKDQETHENLYWEFHKQGGKQAVRWGDWKGIRVNVYDNPNGPIELYDLSVDISEENNVAKLNPGIVKKIDSIMDDAHEHSNAFPFKKG